MTKNYAVQTFDGTEIGQYDTLDEAIEAAKEEWSAQNEACKDEELDPMIADEEWIFIRRTDSDEGGAYITRAGEVKKY